MNSHPYPGYALKLAYAGDPALMLPAAAAVAVWLLIGRAWRLALWWCVLFGAGLALVVASKIAFLAWGTGLQAPGFKAVSGHAMQTTAVLPVLFYLLLQYRAPIRRAAAVLLGLACGTAMGAFLVAFGFHTVLEALAGCVIGGAVSLAFVALSGPRTLPLPGQHPWLLPGGMLAYVLVWHAQPASLEPRMRDIARHLSGQPVIYSLATGKPSG